MFQQQVLEKFLANYIEKKFSYISLDSNLKCFDFGVGWSGRIVRCRHLIYFSFLKFKIEIWRIAYLLFFEGGLDKKFQLKWIENE